MNDIYYFLAAISYGIFLVQFVLSWFGGNTDLDVDLDGELDMNIGDIVSFKGLIHFIMGFSGWLCIRHSIEWYDYLIAVVLGIAFMIILYVLYKACLKLQYEPVSSEIGDLVGRIGVVTIPCKDRYYLNVVTKNAHYEEVLVYPEDLEKEYSVGTWVTITKYENGKYYIN